MRLHIVPFGFLILCSCHNQTSVNDGYGDYLLIPSGEFQMGDNFNEGDPHENPVHTVYLDAYFIGKYHVTNGEYKRFIDYGGYTSEKYRSKEVLVTAEICLCTGKMMNTQEGEYPGMNNSL